MEEEHPWLKGRTIYGVADPAIWDCSRGESVYETACKHRIYFQKGDNRRIAGWMQVHYRLAFDDEGYPQMYIFNNCRAFLRTMPLLTYGAGNGEDVDSDLEDHVADEVRYFCMMRPIAPQKKAVERPLGDDPLDMVAGAGRFGKTQVFR